MQLFVKALDPTRTFDVWIAAEDGRDTYAARGLVRSLHHEYPAWSLHFISFPTSYAQDQQWEGVFRNLPLDIRAEDEVVVSSTGEYLVPRMSLIPPVHDKIQPTKNTASSFRMQVISSAPQIASVTSFVGRVEESVLGGHTMKKFALGVTEHPIDSEFGVDRTSVYFHHGEENWDQFAAGIGGLIVAPLALGISTFENRLGECGRLHILLTHSKSDIGKVVLRLYEKRGVKVTAVDSIDIVGLSRLRIDCFDAIVSGHSSRDFLEVARLFTRNGTGQVYSWSQGERSLPELVKKNPAVLGEALRSSLAAEYHDFIPVPPIRVAPLQSGSSEQLFRGNKSYLLLGGIGSLGPHIALWMYQVCNGYQLFSCFLLIGYP